MLAFDRRAFTYEEAAIVQAKMATHLASFIPQGSFFHACYEFGCGTGLLTSQLLHRSSFENMLLNDQSPQMLHIVEQKLQAYRGDSLHQVKFVADSAENLSHPRDSFDLIASSATLQWIASPFTFLQQTLDSLRPQGILLLATFGEKNLYELRSLTQRGLSYPTLEEFKDFFSSKQYTLLHAEEELIPLFFPTMKSLFCHLQHTGVNSFPSTPEAPHPLRPQELKALATSYQALFSSPEGLSLTYHPIYLVVVKNDVPLSPEDTNS